jgi:hypothetical protein
VSTLGMDSFQIWESMSQSYAPPCFVECKARQLALPVGAGRQSLIQQDWNEMWSDRDTGQRIQRVHNAIRAPNHTNRNSPFIAALRQSRFVQYPGLSPFYDYDETLYPASSRDCFQSKTKIEKIRPQILSVLTARGFPADLGHYLANGGDHGIWPAVRDCMVAILDYDLSPSAGEFG